LNFSHGLHPCKTAVWNYTFLFIYVQLLEYLLITLSQVDKLKPAVRRGFLEKVLAVPINGPGDSFI